MAADAFILHDSAKEYIGDGTIDLDNDAFKAALYLSTSNVATTSVNGIAAATNEHAGANGYTAGGQALTAVTWVNAAGTITFDSADPVWTAAGGSIVARYLVVYDDTVAAPVAKPIIGHILLDNTPADVTATTGNTLTYQVSANGYFQAS